MPENLHVIATPLPAAMAEAELVLRAARGDAAAFEGLMRRHNQRVFRTARSILRSDAEAEEAAQDAWLKAWRGLGRFRGESRFSTWITRIVRNEALGRLRQGIAQVIPLEAAMISSDPEIQAALADQPGRNPETMLARTELRRLMEARIDRLPDVYRTVFVLRALEDMSVEDVAAALEIPEGTVRSRFFRARSLLRESLAQDMDTAQSEAFAFDGARCDRLVAGVMARARAEGLCD